MKKCRLPERSRWTRHRPFSRRFLLSSVCTVMIGLALGAAAIPSRAGVLDDLKSSLGSLWGNKSDKRAVARQARSKASSANALAQARRNQLAGVQKTLLQANEVYFNYWGQMRRTEAQLVRTRHRRLIVTSRYNRRRILFGRRLAAMQRSGKLSYLQVFFGSNTLSDLTRRFYLYNALVSRDATLQGDLRQDKAELDELHNKLAAQWQDRNRLQRLANRERERVVRAEQEQRRTLQKLLSSRNDWLAYASEQVRATREIDATINRINARRNAIVASYEQAAAAEEARERAEEARQEAASRRSRGRRSRRSSNYALQRDDDRQSSGYSRSRRSRYRRSSYRSSRRRRYARVRVPYRVQRTYRVPSAGGVLKPMSISEIAFKDQLVPVPQSSGSLDAPVRSDSGSSRPVDDFPASDPAP
ncbi:MAG: hypothetical protein JWN98_1323 [Abditibacteriota bacterium]|nr:hypothetical protein [Abditibacteriota bacterium]